MPEPRRYVLVLDPAIPEEAILIVTLDFFQQIQSKRFAAQNPAIGSDKHVTVLCSECGRDFGGTDPRNAARAVKAHIRQIHPEKWSQMKTHRE